jgi:hypothetical protein
MHGEHAVHDPAKRRFANAADVAQECFDDRHDVFFITVPAVEPAPVRSVIDPGGMLREKPLADELVHELDEEARTEDGAVNIEHGYFALLRGASNGAHTKYCSKYAPRNGSISV